MTLSTDSPSHTHKPLHAQTSGINKTWTDMLSEPRRTDEVYTVTSVTGELSGHNDPDSDTEMLTE